MANENTKGVAGFLGLLTNGFQKSFIDRVFKISDDIINFFPLITEIDEITGVTKIDDEVLMDDTERDQVRDALRGELLEGNERFNRNITDGVMGIYAFYNLGMEKGETLGIEKGRRQLIAELKSGKAKIEGLQVKKA